MPGLRTTVRKIEPESLPSLDEQLWPIYGAILVLAAFLSGVVASVGSGDVARPSWHRLIGWVGIVFCSLLLIWLVRRVSPRRVRRVTWLASLISLFAHAVLVVVMGCWQLFSHPEVPAKSLAFRQRDPKAVVVPEYAIPPVQPQDDQTSVYDRPVETEWADNAEPSLPRTTAATTRPVEPLRPTADRKDTWVDVAATSPRRQSPEFPAPSTSELPSLPRHSARVPQIVRSTRAEPIHPSEANAAVRSHTDADAAHELSRQEVATSPQRAHDISHWTEMAEDTSPAPTRPTRARYTEGMAVAHAMETLRRRSASIPTRDVTAAELPAREPTARQSSVVAEFALADQPSTAQRHPSSAAELTKAELPTQSGPAESSTSQVVRAEPSRDPTIDPLQPQRELPRRARRVASQSTPVEIPMPWITDVHRPTEPEASDLAPAALAQSTDGSAGLGRESGFLDQELGADRAAPSARNSALRRHVTQTMAADLAMAPSEPARLPRRTAQQAMRAQAEGSIPLPQPSIAGEPLPSEASADASAVAKRAAADAARDLVTAAIGEASFDTGPPQMERKTPLSRASGGGQPEFNFQPPEPTRRRDARGRPPSAALRAEQLATRPSAELGQGGGTPQEYAAADAAQLVPSTAGRQQLAQLPPPATSTPDGHAAMALAPRTARPQRVMAASRGESPANIATRLRPQRRQDRRSSPFVASVAAEVLQPAGQPDPSAAAVVLSSDLGPQRSDPGSGLPLAELARSAGPHAMPSTDAAVAMATGRPLLRQVTATSPGNAQSAGRAAVDGRAETPPSANLRRRRDRSVASQLPGREPSIVISTPAFAHRRARRLRGPGTGLPAPLPKTEQAVERGLRFLARYQGTDGRWSLHQWGDGHPEFDREVPSLRSDTAATALALLAFLGAGYHHRTDRYDAAVAHGLEYLLRNQSPDGDLFIAEDELSNRSVALYSHAIATLAVTEAYGMTQDPALREPAQRAMAFIAASQHPQWGGWRYAPGISADTSVSGWMSLALRSGELANLRVPRSVYPGIDRWLNAAQASDEMPYLYRYNPHAPNTQAQRQGRRPTHVMTAVGLLMRMLRGTDRDGPMLQAGATYLREHLPAIGTRGRPLRDTYYWYYGTQVMFHMGGDDWERWNASLHPLLVGEQVTEGDFAGSWDPLWPIADRWGPHAGRLYVTAMNLLSLEVYYRHLPLYESHR